MNSKLRQTLPASVLAVAIACLLMASPAAADQVINDDLIVTSSLCVGFDCVNGESFGFDTIRVKENNLRIHFQDTSNSASFPTRDWRIVANDTTNGGASFLAFEDTDAGRQTFKVFADARANALVVSSSSKIGIGTATPTVDVHIKTGNTPTLRLDQDGTSGFTAQVWDVAGNEANFFVRDVTNGSQLPFRIQPGADSNSLFIASDNDVGIGTASPEKALHVRRTSASDTQLLKLSVTGAGAGFLMKNESVANEWEIFGSNAFFINNTANPGIELNIGPTGDVTILGNCADGNGAGGGTDGCDFVFDPAYKLDSIEDHAAAMWEKSHLPAVGPTPEGQRIPLNLPGRLFGMLNELEKAHIYIDQLNERIKDKDSQMDDLRERLARLEAAASKTQ